MTGPPLLGHGGGHGHCHYRGPGDHWCWGHQVEVVGVVEEEEVGQDWRQGLGHQLCQAGELHWASSLPAPSAAVSGPS